MVKRLVYNMYLKADKRGMFPSVLRKWAGRRVDLIEQRGRKWIAENPYRCDPPEWKGTGQYPYVLGIIKELWHQHWPFIAACRELGVSYKVLDITGTDWLRIVEDANCDAILARPSVQLSVWRQMYEERLYVISKVLHKTIFPTFEELWLWESKRRMCYWLQANQIPHAKTWVLYDMAQALEFVNSAELPIVYKSDLGSGASGVIVFRDRNQLRRHIRMCFRSGFTTYKRSPQDKEWRYVLLQEYIPNAKEWRMIRIGGTYIGHQKGQIGDFHSGTNIVIFAEPPRKLLDFVRTVTDCGGFASMDVDIFETSDGRYLVNELQTLFGPDPIQMKVDGRPGRYIYDKDNDRWVFEEGVFAGDSCACCNLRVKYLLEQLAR